MSRSYNMQRDIDDQHTGWKGGTQRMGGKGSRNPSRNSLKLVIVIAWLRQAAAEPMQQINYTDLQVSFRAHNNPFRVKLITEEEVYYPDIDQLVFSRTALPCQREGDLLTIHHPEFGCFICGCFDSHFTDHQKFDVRCVSPSACSSNPEPPQPIPSCAPYESNKSFANPDDKCQICICTINSDQQGVLRKNVECERNPECDCAPFGIDVQFAHPTDECQVCVCLSIIDPRGFPKRQIQCQHDPACDIPSTTIQHTTTTPSTTTPFRVEPDCTPNNPLEEYIHPADNCQICVCTLTKDPVGVTRKNIQCRLNTECDCSPFEENKEFPHPSDNCQACMCLMTIDQRGLPKRQIQCKRDPACDATTMVKIDATTKTQVEIGCDPFQQNEWFVRPDDECQLCICQVDFNYLGQEVAEYSCRQNPKCEQQPPKPTIECDPFPENQWYERPDDHCQICICYKDNNQDGLQPHTECKLNPECRTPIASTPAPEADCRPFPENEWFPHPNEHCHLCMCHKGIDQNGKTGLQTVCKINPNCICSPFSENEWFPRPGNACERCICQTSLDALGQLIPEYYCQPDPECESVIPSTPSPEAGCKPFPEKEWFPHPTDNCRICLCHQEVDQAGHAVIKTECRLIPACRPTTTPDPFIPTAIPTTTTRTTPAPEPEPVCNPYPEGKWFIHPENSCQLCVCQKTLDIFGRPAAQYSCNRNPECDISTTPKTTTTSQDPTESTSSTPAPTTPSVPVCSPFPEEVWFPRPGNPCELCICRKRVDIFGKQTAIFPCRSNPECEIPTTTPESTTVLSVCSPFAESIWFQRPGEDCEFCICQVAIGYFGQPIAEYLCERNQQCDLPTTTPEPSTMSPPVSVCIPFSENKWFPRPGNECELCICRVRKDELGNLKAEFPCRPNPKCEPSTTVAPVKSTEGPDCSPFTENESFLHPTDACRLCVCRKEMDQDGKAVVKTECRNNTECQQPEPITTPPVPTVPVTICSSFPENQWFLRPGNPCEVCICYSRIAEDKSGESHQEFACRPNPECEEPTTSTVPTVPPPPSNCSPYQENQWFPRPGNRCMLCICKIVNDEIGNSVAEYSCKENPVCNKPLVPSTTHRPAIQAAITSTSAPAQMSKAPTDCSQYGVSKWFQHPTSSCEVCVCKFQNDILGISKATFTCKSKPECDCSPYKLNEWYLHAEDSCLLCICRPITSSSGLQQTVTQCVHNPYCVSSVPILAEQPADNVPTCAPFPTNIWFENPFDKCSVCLCYHQIGKPSVSSYCKLSNDCAQEIQESLPTCDPMPINEWVPRLDDPCQLCICTYIVNAVGVPEVINMCMSNPTCGNHSSTIEVPDCSPNPINEWYQEPTDPCKLCICYPVTKPNGEVTVQSNCVVNPQCVNPDTPDSTPSVHPPSKTCYPFPMDQYFPSPSDRCVACKCTVARDPLTSRYKANIQCQHLQHCLKPIKAPVPTPGHTIHPVMPLPSVPTCEPNSPYVWFKNPLDPCESCICYHAVNEVGQPMVQYECVSNGECGTKDLNKKQDSCKYEGDIYSTNCQVCICRVMENGDLYPFCKGPTCEEAAPDVVLPTCDPYPTNKWFSNPDDKCGYCLCYYDSSTRDMSVKTMCVTRHCDTLNHVVPELDDCSPFPLNEWYVKPSAPCEVCICRPDAENSLAGQLKMMTYCTRNPQCDSSVLIRPGAVVVPSLPNAMDCSPFVPNQNFKPPNKPCEICTCKFEAGAMNVVCQTTPQCGSSVAISDCRPNQQNRWYPHPVDPCILCICRVIQNALGQLSRTTDCKPLLQCSSNNSPALPEPPVPSCHPFPTNEWFQDMEDECKACICIHVINKSGVPKIQLRCRPNPSCLSNSTVQPLPTCSPLPMNKWFEHPDRYCDMCICYFADNGRGEPTVQTFCTPTPGCGQPNGISQIELPSCAPFPMNEWYTHPSEYCRICICQIKGDEMGQPNAVTKCYKNPECDKDTDTKISPSISPTPQGICFPVREDEWFHRDNDMSIVCICRKGFEISGRPKAVVECIRNPQCVTPSWVPYPVWPPTQMEDCDPFPINQWFPHITEVCTMCICRPHIRDGAMYAQMDCVPIPQCGQQNETTGVFISVPLPPADTSCHPYPTNQYFQYSNEPCRTCICRPELNPSKRLTMAIKCYQLTQCTDIANMNIDKIIAVIVPIDLPKIDAFPIFDEQTIVDAVCQSYPLDQVFQHPNESCINCYCAKQASQVISICVPDPICNGAIPSAITPPLLPSMELEVVDVICHGYKQQEKFIHPNDVCRQCQCTVVQGNKLIAKCRYHELCKYPVAESTMPEYIEPICKHYGLEKIFSHPTNPCYTCQCVIAFNHVLTNCELSPDCETPLQPPPGPAGPPQPDFPDGSDTDIFFLEPNCRYRQLNKFYVNPGQTCQICQCRMLYNIVFVSCKTMTSCNNISGGVIDVPFIDPICKQHPHGSVFQHPLRKCLECSCKESELGTAARCQATPACNAEENAIVKFVDPECKNYSPGTSFDHPTRKCQRCSCQMVYNVVQMVCKDNLTCVDHLLSTTEPNAPKKKPKCKYEGDMYHWNCQACFCRTTEKGDLYSVCQGTPCGTDELIFD